MAELTKIHLDESEMDLRQFSHGASVVEWLPRWELRERVVVRTLR